LSAAFVVTGTLLAGPPLALAVDHTPAVAAPMVAPRDTAARTRLSDHLPPVSNVPAPPQRIAALSAPPPASLASPIEGFVAALNHAGEGGRRVAVIGAAREVGTTLTAIALARALARNARVVVVDLAFNSPNIDVISTDPAAPGLADLVRGQASFSGIITRDKASRAHVVAAGRLEGDRHALLTSHMLVSALDALAQSYDYLVVDAGAQSDVSMAPIVRVASHALLVAGGTAEATTHALRDQLLAAGFADVMVMTGPPPQLVEAPAGHSAAA
jgi:Mrp family chromosome partitioning ATPase